MRAAILALVLAGCAATSTPTDGGFAGDTGCTDVAAAYERARARFGCSYDWPACPRTLTNAECVDMFAGTVSCGHLDTIASMCSL